MPRGSKKKSAQKKPRPPRQRKQQSAPRRKTSPKKRSASGASSSRSETLAALSRPSLEQMHAINFLVDADGNQVTATTPALMAHGISSGDAPVSVPYVPVQNGGLPHVVKHHRDTYRPLSIPTGEQLTIISAPGVHRGEFYAAVYSIAAPTVDIDDASRTWHPIIAEQDGGYDTDVLYRFLSGCFRLTWNISAMDTPLTVSAGRLMGCVLAPCLTDTPGSLTTHPVIEYSLTEYQTTVGVTPDELISSCPQRMRYIGAAYEKGAKVAFVGPVSGSYATGLNINDDWTRPTGAAAPAAEFNSSEAMQIAAVMTAINNDDGPVTVYIDTFATVAVHDCSSWENNEHVPGYDPQCAATYMTLWHAPAFAGPNSFLSFLKSVGRVFSAPVRWAGERIKDFVRSGKLQTAVSGALAGAQAGGAKGALAGAVGALVPGVKLPGAAPGI